MLVQALLCPLCQGAWEKGRWSLLGSKQVRQHGLSLLAELCVPWQEWGQERKWAVCQGADGLGKVQMPSAVAFSEKIKQNLKVFFLSLILHGSCLNLEATAPKFICKFCDRQSWLLSLNNLIVQKFRALLSSIPSTRVF